LQDLRDLECLIALARFQHFARAADDCGLSQPAFSMRIRGLEDRLGKKIVKRGNRFLGLTADGETVLEHAKLIIGQVQAMEQEVKAKPGELAGSLTIGVIPTAVAYAARVARNMNARHPGVKMRLKTDTSLAIQQGVDDGRFDAGLVYTEGASADILEVLELFDERYVLLLPNSMAPSGQDTIRWAEAALLPLILLEPDMQNRRIVDRAFREVGGQPKVVAETNGFLAAIVMVSEGMGAMVIPDVLHAALGGFKGTRALALVEPELEKRVCLVSRRRERTVPSVAALREVLIASPQ